MSYSFSIDMDLPPRLQDRLKEWDTSTPRSQYQQYGPINMFLTKKFAADCFIVKPQALLREILEIPQDIEEQDMEVLITGVLDQNMDVDGYEELRKMVNLGHKKTVSSDSYALPVTQSQEGKMYPDFVVTAYRPLFPGGDEPQARKFFGEGKDVVRLIVEVASLLDRDELSENRQVDLLVQLHRYMDNTGKEGQRWKKYVAGIAIAGNKFFYLEPDRSGKFKFDRNALTWFDLNSDEFIAIIEKARNLNTTVA